MLIGFSPSAAAMVGEWNPCVNKPNRYSTSYAESRKRRTKSNHDSTFAFFVDSTVVRLLRLGAQEQEIHGRNMMPVSRRVAVLGLASSACIGPAASLRAQTDFPDKPIRFIVPFGAGGTMDVVARAVGNE